MAMTARYAWKNGAQYSGPAQPIGEELARIHKEEGDVTAEKVVRRAEDVNNPLHDEFEWDDTTAAHEHRKTQARYVIRHVKTFVVQEDGSERGVPAFVNVKVVDPETFTSRRVYYPIEKVSKDQELSEQVLTKALAELDHWTAKYENLKELMPIIEAIGVVKVNIYDTTLAPE